MDQMEREGEHVAEFLFDEHKEFYKKVEKEAKEIEKKYIELKSDE